MGLRKDESAEKNSLDAHIGARIREQRRALRISVLKAAKLLGISQQQMSRIELGQNRVFAAQLCTLSRAYRVPITYFFEGYEEPEEELRRIQDVLGSSVVPQEAMPSAEQGDALTVARETMPADIRTTLEQLTLILARHLSSSSPPSSTDDSTD